MSLRFTNVFLSLLLSLPLSADVEDLIAPPTFGGLSGPQDELSVASDGHEFLGVWITLNGLLARRFDSTGTPLGHSILVTGDLTYGTHIVWAGSHYAVVTNSRAGMELLALSPNGTLLWRKTIGSNESAAAISWNGAHLLVASLDQSRRTTGTLITSDGTIVRDAIPLWPAAGACRLTAADGRFWLTIGDADGIHLRRIESNGEPGTAMRLGDAVYAEPAIAAHYGDVLVAWTGATSTALHLSLIRSESVISRSVPLPEETDRSSLRSVWDGEAFALFFQQAKSVRSIRISTNGALLDPAPRTAVEKLALASLDDVAANGSTLLLATREHDGLGVRVVTHRFARTVAIDSDLVSIGTIDQTRPAIAPTPNGFLVAWLEQASDAHSLYVTHVGTDGRATRAPRLVERFEGIGGPRLAAGRDSALLTWNLFGAVHAERIAFRCRGASQGTARRFTERKWRRDR